MMQVKRSFSYLPLLYFKSRRTKFAPTVCKINFCENIVPLARQRCVESPHPTSCVSINYCKFCVRMISATVAYYNYFERQRNNPSVSVYAKPVPLAGTPKWILRQIPICIFFSYSIAKNKTAAAKLLWLSVFMILFLIPKLP